MSIWGKIAGGLETALGIGTGNPGLIAAGVGTFAADSATSDAAQKQADATSQALALQKSMYDTTRGDLAPYTQTGVGALGNLRQLAGVTMPASASATPAGMASTGAPNMVGQRPAPPNTPIVGTAVPRAQTNSGFVTMQAPDGTTNQVDPAHVPYYQKLGAQVINASGYAPQQAVPR